MKRINNKSTRKHYVLCLVISLSLAINLTLQIQTAKQTKKLVCTKESNTSLIRTRLWNDKLWLVNQNLRQLQNFDEARLLRAGKCINSSKLYFMIKYCLTCVVLDQYSTLRVVWVIWPACCYLPQSALYFSWCDFIESISVCWSPRAFSSLFWIALGSLLISFLSRACCKSAAISPAHCNT